LPTICTNGVTRTLGEVPDSFEVYYRRANTKLCMGDTVGAVADITDAIRCNAKDPALYYFRGLWNLELARFSEALADFDRAISRDVETHSESYTEPSRMASAVAHLYLEEFEAALRESEGVDAGRKSFFGGRIWSVDEIRTHAAHRRKPY
jgi:tetratricopeptide (TPR) repeat protein